MVVIHHLNLRNMKNLILIGVGNWGLEVWSWLSEAKGYGEDFIFKGFLSNNLNELDDVNYCNAKIIGLIDGYKIKKNDVFVCTIGNFASKLRVTTLYENNGANFINLIHKSAIFFKGYNLGLGIIISPYCVISNNSKIADHVSINLGSTIGHDTEIGKYSVISSQCDITGGVVLSECVFLGSKVTIAPKRKISSNVKIGLGSVVIKSIKKKGTYIGNPAKKII